MKTWGGGPCILPMGPTSPPSQARSLMTLCGPLSPPRSRGSNPFLLLRHLGRPLWIPQGSPGCVGWWRWPETELVPRGHAGASHWALVRSSLVGQVVRKCSRVGVQSLLGIKSGQPSQPEARYITQWGAGTSHLPALCHSVSAPSARPERRCFPGPPLHAPDLQLQVKRICPHLPAASAKDPSGPWPDGVAPG